MRAGAGDRADGGLSGLSWVRPLIRGERAPHREGLEDAATLFEDVEVVGGEIAEDVFGAGGPEEFNLVGLGCGVEAEVDAEVVLRVVAAAAADLFDLAERLFANAGVILRSGLGGDDDAGADAGAIALFANDADLDPVAGDGGFAMEELRRGVDAVDDGIHVAVVVV